jgi:hypothetical protein
MLKFLATGLSSILTALLLAFAVFLSLNHVCSSGIPLEKIESHWWHTFFCEIRVGELAAAIFTLFLVVFTGFLWWSTDELRRATTNAAEAQATDTRLLQRAYLSVEPRGIKTLQSDGTKILGYIGIHNVGNLLAKEVSWSIAAKWSASEMLKLDDLPVTEPDVTKNALFVKTEMIIGSDGIDLAQTGGTRNPKGYLYVWGLVRYLDGFGSIRYTQFCHRYFCGSRDPTFTNPQDPSFRIAGSDGRYNQYGNDAW